MITNPDVGDPLVMSVQRQLHEKGYYNVGIIDGQLLPRGETEAAILDFRNKNGLPLSTGIDSEFLQVLENAPVRQISLTRAFVEPSDLTDKVSTVQQNWWTRMWTRLLAVPMWVGFVVSLIVDNLGSAATSLTAVKQFFGDHEVPTWVWFGLIGLAAYLIGRSARKTDDAAADSFRVGAIQPDLMKKEDTP